MASVIKEPLIIYRDILIPLLKASGFQLDFDESDDKRYHTRFIWSSSYVDTDLKSPMYGQTRHFESKVDVVGIPMGFSFLILHGIVVGAIADECDDVKLKIRCAPRTKSLSCSSTDSGSSPPPANQQLVGAANNNRSNSLAEESESAEDYQQRIRLQLQTEFVYKLIEMFSLKLDDLPLELKLRIMSLLPLKSIVSLSRVSTDWRELSLDEQLWRLMVQKFFPDVFASRVPGQSWKALFKDEFRRQKVFEKRRAFAAARNNRGMLPALPPSPPLLPIAPPPFYPMLPPPPNYIRDLFPPHNLLPPGPFYGPFWDDDHHLNGMDIPPPRAPGGPQPPNRHFPY